MDEKNLLKVALVCSIIGIFIIFIFADKLEPPVIKISEISEKLIEESVIVNGEVAAVRINPEILIFDIVDEGSSIKVIAFNDNNIKLSKGDFVRVFGEITDYKGALEIEAKEITSLSD